MPVSGRAGQSATANDARVSARTRPREIGRSDGPIGGPGRVRGATELGEPVAIERDPDQWQRHQRPATTHGATPRTPIEASGEAIASQAWIWVAFTLATVAASQPIRGVTVPGARGRAARVGGRAGRGAPERGHERREQQELDIAAPDARRASAPRAGRPPRTTTGWRAADRPAARARPRGQPGPAGPAARQERQRRDQRQHERRIQERRQDNGVREAVGEVDRPTVEPAVAAWQRDDQVEGDREGRDES